MFFISAAEVALLCALHYTLLFLTNPHYKLAKIFAF